MKKSFDTGIACDRCGREMRASVYSWPIRSDTWRNMMVTCGDEGDDGCDRIFSFLVQLYDPFRQRGNVRTYSAGDLVTLARAEIIRRRLMEL